MNDKNIRIESVLAELSAALVRKYELTPRDAVGIVMQSKLAERILNGDDEVISLPIDQLAVEVMN